MGYEKRQVECAKNGATRMSDHEPKLHITTTVRVKALTIEFRVREELTVYEADLIDRALRLVGCSAVCAVHTTEEQEAWDQVVHGKKRQGGDDGTGKKEDGSSEV